MDARYQVGPVAKALRVLDIVAASEAGVRLSRVTLLAGLPKTTALRYLRTLEAAGYLEADGEHEIYRIGSRFRLLKEPTDQLKRLCILALPEMIALRDCFDETINLGVLRGREIVYVEIVESNRRLRLQARVGGRDPAHSTALGKAILSRLSAARRAVILAPQLAARTAKTARTRGSVEAELTLAAELGYAVERGENEEGAVCVGAAITASTGQPLAALSMSAPETRMPAHQVRLAGEALRAAAHLLSERIAVRDHTLPRQPAAGADRAGAPSPRMPVRP